MPEKDSHLASLELPLEIASFFYPKLQIPKLLLKIMLKILEAVKKRNLTNIEEFILGTGHFEDGKFKENFSVELQDQLDKEPLARELLYGHMRNAAISSGRIINVARGRMVSKIIMQGIDTGHEVEKIYLRGLIGLDERIVKFFLEVNLIWRYAAPGISKTAFLVGNNELANLTLIKVSRPEAREYVDVLISNRFLSSPQEVYGGQEDINFEWTDNSEKFLGYLQEAKEFSEDTSIF